MNGFIEKLNACAKKNRSMLCVGLDPALERLPAGIPRSAKGVLEFNLAIIEATQKHVCAYKPNAAFYESLGAAGHRVLKATIDAVPEHIPVILDAKRGDIGNTARQYAISAFEKYGADAVTLSPYLGGDSLEPFLQYSDRGIIILCRTSNPGGADFQNLTLKNGKPLYMEVARRCKEWNKKWGNVAVVVGATAPKELARVRKVIGDQMPVLLPGIGAQGGDAEAALKAGLGSTPASVVVNASRGVIFASDKSDYAQAAARAADLLRKSLNRIRKSLQ
jgi:orotidine-5'-phosphate decarboxylase